MKPRLYLAACLILMIVVSGCKKYLEAKSDQSLKVINTLEDLQALLDNYSKINTLGPSADEVSSDEYYLTNASYQALTADEMRNMYAWQPFNVFYPYTNITNDWTQLYNTVYIANVVLDNINNVPRTTANGIRWDNIKGQAHFLRAYAFLKAAGIWALAYDSQTAEMIWEYRYVIHLILMFRRSGHRSLKPTHKSSPTQLSPAS